MGQIVRGASLTPPTPEAGLTVWWPKPGEPLRIQVLDYAITGVHTHWIRGEDGAPSRTILCLRPIDCIYCESSRPGWVGYVAVINLRSHTVGVAAISPSGALSVANGLQDGEPFRGTAWEIARSGPSRNSPLAAQRIHSPNRKLPEPPSLRPALRSIYGAVADSVLDGLGVAR